MNQFSSDFLVELLKSCILSKDIIEVIKPHLQYSFLPTEVHKELFKFVFDYHTANNKAPTIGLISQSITSAEATDVIAKVKDVNIYDSKDQILVTFEKFIKKNWFYKAHSKAADLFNDQKHDEALEFLASETKLINSLNIKNKGHSRVFADFDKRQAERQTRDFSLKKIPTGIPAFDHHTHGGPEKGAAGLIVARSGVGKSTALRWLGYSAMFRGFNVVHFQAEGTKAQVEDAYDSMWTGVNLHDIKRGDLSSVDIKKIEKTRKDYLAQCGEIFVCAFEQFHAASIAQCRSILIDIMKDYPVDLVLFDYLEKFEPGDGKRYGTNQDGVSSRKLATSEKIVNIATEFDVVAWSATQASNIEKTNWNNPNWVLTREDISNLKATIDAFAYCGTLNQTIDENDKEVLRFHEEKLREYKIKSYEATYHIAQARSLGRFVDVAKTKQMFWDDVNKRVIKTPAK